MTRKEMYKLVKDNMLEESIKSIAKKSYTNCSNAELASLLEKLVLDQDPFTKLVKILFNKGILTIRELNALI